MHYAKDPLPGTIFGGRFPINVWPRPLWAFEWHDPSKPIKINRGEPLFYATFETLPQDRSVAMAEVEVTPELEAAEARRPETLVKPIKRKPGSS